MNSTQEVMMRRFLYKSLWAIAGIISFHFLEIFTHQQTDGFSIARIQPSNHFCMNSTTVPSNVLKILNQPFHYNGCGRQSFTFFSEDGAYVLKFLKRTNRFAPDWSHKIPILNRFKPFRKEKYEKEKMRKTRDYQGYYTAFLKAPEETALSFVLLGKAQEILPTITLWDPLNNPLSLDLNKTHFILQKRAIVCSDMFNQWISEGNLTSQENAIKEMLLFCKARVGKGIFDDDPSFFKNFGFLNGKVVQLDPGEYDVIPDNEETPQLKKANLLLSFSLFNRWLKTSYPHLLPLAEAYEKTL